MSPQAFELGTTDLALQHFCAETNLHLELRESESPPMVLRHRLHDDSSSSGRGAQDSAQVRAPKEQVRARRHCTALNRAVVLEAQQQDEAARLCDSITYAFDTLAVVTRAHCASPVPSLDVAQKLGAELRSRSLKDRIGAPVTRCREQVWVAHVLNAAPTCVHTTRDGG